MRMQSVFAVLAVPAAIVLATPATAMAEETGSFEHNGYTYSYKVQQQGESQLISGHRYPGGVPFSLRVRNGVVSGISEGTQVSFKVKDAKGALAAAKPAELSLR